MKLLLIILFAANCDAALFGISPRLFNKKINEMENSTQKQFSENQLKLTGLESRIEKLEVNISAQAQAVARVQAGYDRSNTETVGRDMIKNTTNDSDLMMQIFQGLSALFLAVIGYMKSRVKALSEQIESLFERIEYLNDSRHKYQDLWIMKLDPEFAKIKMEMEKKQDG